MSDMQKSHWVADASQIHTKVEFTKVDKENRLVSGFATLDNEDSHDDVVEADASRGAFERFRGNIREMHQPIAVGRLADFYEDSYYDPKTGIMHKGIYVSAYVSKGAQDTWEKVLDGTLTGFSIGGNIKKSESEFVKDASGDGGKAVRFIKEYDLIELSLVDNPANQLANVFSIQKSDTGSVIKGMVTDVEVVNVFWCESDKLAKNSSEESATCRVCGDGMKVIGWFEKGEDETTKVEETVTKFLRQREDDKVTNGEGGVNKMADENVNEETPKVDAEATEVAVPVDEVPSEELTEEELAAEEEAVPVEVQAEPDFEKLFDSLKSSLDETRDSVQKAVSAVETKVDEKVDGLTKAVDENTSKYDEMRGELRDEFQKGLDALSERLDGIKVEREGVEKRLEALESSTAIKKSADDEDSAENNKLQKGFWSGTILNGS